MLHLAKTLRIKVDTAARLVFNAKLFLERVASEDDFLLDFREEIAEASNRAFSPPLARMRVIGAGARSFSANPKGTRTAFPQPPIHPSASEQGTEISAAPD